MNAQQIIEDVVFQELITHKFSWEKRGCACGWRSNVAARDFRREFNVLFEVCEEHRKHLACEIAARLTAAALRRAEAVGA